MWIMTNCQSRECARYWLILFPDLLWTKPKARSGQIRFALRDRLSGMASAHAQHKFGAVKAKADFDAYNKLTRGLRHDLGIFARISKFHCFHETKQTQNKVERFFFYNLAGFAFEYFCDSRRILVTFSKSYLNSHVATWSYRFTRHPARELKPPSISHISFLT